MTEPANFVPAWKTPYESAAVRAADTQLHREDRRTPTTVPEVLALPRRTPPTTLIIAAVISVRPASWRIMNTPAALENDGGRLFWADMVAKGTCAPPLSGIDPIDGMRAAKNKGDYGATIEITVNPDRAAVRNSVQVSTGRDVFCT